MLSLNLLYIAIILNHNIVSILLLTKLNSQKHDLSVCVFFVVVGFFFFLSLFQVHWELLLVFGRVEMNVHRLLTQCKDTWGRQDSESFAK